jgi:TIR domain
MAQVFLSYARRDLPTLQPLLQNLVAHGITVWRDQDSLYGGQRWPKAIGEAIAAHDVLLLVWSQEAAASHFVEFEWNTALALQKSILPCLLDQTPLPPALRAINGIDARLPHEALSKILQALQQAGHASQGRAERQGYHDSSGDHRHRPCRSRSDRQGHVYAARLARARQRLSGREGHSRYACTPACQDLVRKMAKVGDLPGGTAQPHHRSIRFADQDTGDLHEHVSDDGSAANCIWHDRG